MITKSCGVVDADGKADAAQAMNRPTIAAPEWHQLPESVRIDFDRSQFGGWYHAADNDRRLTLINNYMKMKPAGLWDFVKEPACEPHETEAGRLAFMANDLQGFHNNLTKRPDFSSPELSAGWRSREDVGDNSLHFKNFENWPLDQVQAHIDPYGLAPSQDAHKVAEAGRFGIGQALTHNYSSLDFTQLVI